MREQKTGQLAAPGWKIPPYAQNRLWVEEMGVGAPALGELGQFTLEFPLAGATLRWDGPEGAVLARLPWPGETDLGWRGAVRLGGYIDALHVAEIPGLDCPLLVVYLGGQPLKPDFSPYPAGKQRTPIPQAPPDFYTGLAAEVLESTSTWLVAESSPLTAYVHDALVNSLRVYCFGQLADEAGGWHNHFALPILLEAMTLFAP